MAKLSGNDLMSKTTETSDRRLIGISSIVLLVKIYSVGLGDLSALGLFNVGGEVGYHFSEGAEGFPVLPTSAEWMCLDWTILSLIREAATPARVEKNTWPEFFRFWIARVISTGSVFSSSNSPPGKCSFVKVFIELGG